MSEWIKRSDREPSHNLRGVWLYDQNTPDFGVWVADPTDAATYTHWMECDAPAPPPREVTIRISEEDARDAIEFVREAAWGTASPFSCRLAEACRKALGEK